MADRRYVCAIDTGGTFTDCVVLDDRGRLTQTKSPSTPAELSRGVFDAMGAAAGALGRDLRDLLAATSHLIVGSTIGTNAVLQQRGARVGMIVTRGHRDVVAIMRGHGRNAGRPVSEAPRRAPHRQARRRSCRGHRIVEVDERIDCFGDVVVGLDREQVAAGVERLVADGVDAIAVCFLWSFLNDRHERAAKEIVQAAAPGMFVTTSSEVVARWGEYERWMAAVINASLGDLTARFVQGIEGRLGRSRLQRAVPADDLQWRMRAGGGGEAAAGAAAGLRARSAASPGRAIWPGCSGTRTSLPPTWAAPASTWASCAITSRCARATGPSGS